MRLAAALATWCLAGCVTSGISAQQVNALERYREREVVVVPPPAGASEIVRRTSAGAAKAFHGSVSSREEKPEALWVETHELDLSDGEVIGSGTRETARTLKGLTLVGDVTAATVGLLSQAERFGNSKRVRVELVLHRRGEEDPLGAVVWEGWRGSDAEATAERAGEEAGAAFARQIALERERWASDQTAGERMFLTPTPQLLQPGEVVLADDELLLVHLGIGLSHRVQFNLGLGGFPLPAAGGVAFAGGGGIAGAGGAGTAVVGVVAPGVKIRLLDEQHYVPGVSFSYDLVDLWGAALGGGAVGILGSGVAGAAGAAIGGVNVQLNVFTLSFGKHLLDWLQLGTGTAVIDNHHLLPQDAGFVAAASTGTSGGVASGSKVVSRLPTKWLGYLNVEADAGRHVHFMSEYVIAPGDDYWTFGMRTILYVGRAMGEMRTGGLRLTLDLAGVVSGYTQDTTGKHKHVLLPWAGMGLYFP